MKGWMSKPDEMPVDEIERLGWLCRRGWESFVECSKLYVALIDKDAANKERIAERYEQEIPSRTWAVFERIGRGQLDPRIAFQSGDVARRIKMLPASDQKVALEQPIAVLAADGTTLRVECRNMTRQQVEQVFDGSHIRNIPQQKAYIESIKGQAKIAEAVRAKCGTYKVDGTKLVVFTGGAPVVFALNQLTEIVKEMRTRSGR